MPFIINGWRTATPQLAAVPGVRVLAPTTRLAKPSASEITSRLLPPSASFAKQALPQHIGHKKQPLTVPCASASPAAIDTTTSQVATRVLRVHYLRKGDDQQGWGLHTWGAAAEHTEWQKPLSPTGRNSEHGSTYWDLPINAADHALVGLLVHKGEQKAARAEVTVPAGTDEVWLVGNEQTAFLTKPAMSDIPAGSMTKQGALWANANTIIWRQALQEGSQPRSFRLYFSKDAKMSLAGSGLQGHDAVYELKPLANDLSPDLLQRFPYLRGCAMFQVPDAAVSEALELMKGQLMVSMHSSDGTAQDATGLQIHGLIDAMSTYDGPLGYHKVSGTSDARAVSVWAPTAHKVELLYWDGPQGDEAKVQLMKQGKQGVWTLEVPSEWYGHYYNYRVTAYCPWTQKVETMTTTDPYSVSLAADGDRTQFLDINDPQLVPDGWAKDVPPALHQWTDISVYELHIRDFSISDATVPMKLRGKYLAFSPQHIAEEKQVPYIPGSEPPTAGLKHLAKLRATGLNHLHLLPTYDFGSVPEREADQAVIEEDLSNHPPASEYQQLAVARVADNDAFNWGYDPVHWGVPDGSYATDPDGPQRIKELRQMVMALHQQGWRVVYDVVYNHTFRNGPHDRYSVLDKLVPGYYFRRMEDGDVCQSTCCNNTAAENYMCERMMIEDLVLWAKHYKADAFRFDIMGHLFISTLEKMRAKLDELTLEKDGVDGKSIYIYGEAWDMGEMIDNQRGLNCSQNNLAGTGLGSFNDRLRDGALGGGPFAPYHHQGLVTGLSLAPNSIQPQQGDGDPGRQLTELLELSDMVRYSLAGNLKDYPLLNGDGRKRTGFAAQLHGQPIAYGALPHEHVAFIGCHDNQTIFDQVTEKAALTVTADERMRMCAMCLSLIALSQGIPFFHAGDDLLRSKSLDRDSYNSGDHFNRMDWTGQDNNFGVGLPLANKNYPNWAHKRTLLANPTLKPTPAQIHTATQIFQLMLRIRYSSPLFRLAKTEDILSQVSFPNTGPDQVPGVIAMHLDSADQHTSTKGVLDPSFKRILVVFNCTPLAQTLDATNGGIPAGSWTLHPLQAGFEHDERTRSGCKVDNGQLLVAARTTAVFVEQR